MNVQLGQIMACLSLAREKSEELRLNFSYEINENDRVYFIWLEKEIVFCEILLFLDTEFVDFSVLVDGTQIEFNQAFSQLLSMPEKIQTVLSFLECVVTSIQR